MKDDNENQPLVAVVSEEPVSGAALIPTVASNSAGGMNAGQETGGRNYSHKILKCFFECKKLPFICICH